jgi:aminopeptidase N
MFATLAEAEALVAHPDFSWTNPNRLRSVVATFAGANLEVKRGSKPRGKKGQSAKEKSRKKQSRKKQRRKGKSRRKSKQKKKKMK